MRYALLLVLLLAALPAAAHGGHDAHPGIDPEALIAVLLLASGALYGVGLVKLWRQAGIGHGTRSWRAASFLAGLATLALSLIWPLPGLSSISFSAHMVEHEALMAVAAPLLVLARPGAIFLWSLPRAARSAVARIGTALPMRRLWRWCTEPAGATAVHGAVLWIWHMPVLFDAATANNALHALQHLTFFASAICFWWAIFERVREGGREGVAILALFVTATHMGLLGALLTVSPLPWYAGGAGSHPGYDALADQQLAGLLMWIPAGFVYALAAIALLILWLEGAARRRRSHAWTP